VLSARDLSSSIFAIVMATGIVSLALNGAGWPLLALGLFWLNVAVYAILGILLAVQRGARVHSWLTCCPSSREARSCSWRPLVDPDSARARGLAAPARARPADL